MAARCVDSVESHPVTYGDYLQAAVEESKQHESGSRMSLALSIFIGTFLGLGADFILEALL